MPRTGCLCRALSLVDGSQHPGAGPWPAREGLAPCGAAPESMVPGRLGAPPGALGGRPRLSPVEPVSRGHSRGGLPQPLGSLRALPSRPPCAPGGTRGDAHTRTPAHTGGEAVSCCSLLSRSAPQPLTICVGVSDSAGQGADWPVLDSRVLSFDVLWLVFVRFYRIFIVIKPRSSILPAPSVPSPAGLRFPPGRPGGMGARSWLQPRFPQV